jgi:hypothetical protein
MSPHLLSSVRSHHHSFNNDDKDSYTSDSDENTTFTWKQFTSFCIISALWIAQQTHAMNTILIEHNALLDLSLSQICIPQENENNTATGLDTESESENSSRLTIKELDTLRFGFSLYDKDLSGEIAREDLVYLLQVCDVW